MDPDVVEITPPIPPPPRMFKHKEITLSNVIEIDDDEDSDGTMFFDPKNKGKSKMFLADGYNNGLVEEDMVNLYGTSEMGSVNGLESSSNFFPGKSSIINIEDISSDESCDYADEYVDLSVDDYMDVDQYAMLQAHFDNSDIPTGIEAPVPFLLDPHQSNKKPTTGWSNTLGLNALGSHSSPAILNEPVHHHHLNGCSKSTPVRSASLPPTLSPPKTAVKPSPPQQILSQLAQSKKKAVVSDMQQQHSKVLGALSKSRWRPFQNRKKQAATSTMSGSTNHESLSQLGRSLKKQQQQLLLQQQQQLLQQQQQQLQQQQQASSVVDPSFWDPVVLPSSNPFLPAQPNKPNNLNGPIWTPQLVTNNPLQPPLPWSHPAFQSKAGFLGGGAQAGFEQWAHLPQGIADVPFWGGSQIPLKNEPVSALESSVRAVISSADRAEVLKKFQVFKQFETVEDHSDHQYKGNGSSTKQPSKSWAKRIQEEWKILEKNLPDNIFVRVYESRMDILRAVIVGAEGTPYHDGLFFFDFFFPNGYPNTPPHVHYHSGGLRLNPNLYNTGKVCLSLLNTWSGSKNEKWLPGKSTMLQVLVSIQALILNAKPYFNEPGYAHSAGTKDGELRSLQYNESTFILSLKTMTYSIRRPPKHFEDFVIGHFLTHAHDIMVACKAYLGGAQVGCLVKGGVQDVDEGDQSCSSHFRDTLASFMNVIVSEFSNIGVEDCDKYLPPPVVNATGEAAGRASSRTGLKMLAISG